MPTYNTTADWAVAQLRQNDWVTRHEMIRGFDISRPRLYDQICKRMSPSELICGTASGVQADHATIILKDKVRKHYKQTSLHMYFRRAVKKPKFKQLTLDTFFSRR